MRAIITSTCLGIALFLSSTTFASAAVLNPDEMRGLRNGPVTGGSTLLLHFSAVKLGTEDRTIAHFDISGIGSVASASLNIGIGSVASASLNIGIGNIDPNAPDGTLDVYSFAGDGVVSVDEWTAGGLINTFTGLGSNLETLTLDITSLLTGAAAAGDNYLSFNFRTTSDDRYWLNHTIGGVTNSVIGEGPTYLPVSEVPVPAAVWLFGTALIGFVGLSRKRSVA